MEGAPRSRGRPRSEEAHAAILSAAIAVIRDVGFDAMTMDGVAARAGVSKPTLYRRWSSRELLVAEALGSIVRAIPLPDTGHVGGDVRALMRVTTGMYRDPASSELLSGLVAAMARSDVIARALREGFVGPWRDAMRRVLVRGRERGELRADADITLALEMLSGPAFHRYLMLGKPITDRFAEQVVETVLRAFAPTTRHSR